MSFTNTSNLQRLIRKPKLNQIIRANYVIDKVNKIVPVTYEDVQDAGYLQFSDVRGVRAAYFNKFAFIQTDSNLNSAGTGLQANNRQELTNDVFQCFILNCPNGDADENKDYFVQNYGLTDLAGFQAEEQINAAFSLLENNLDLLYANRLLFGTTRVVTTFGSVSATTEQYWGLAQVIAACKADPAITSVDNINLLPSTVTLCRNIDLTSSVSDLDTFAQLKNLDNKMSQVNNVFAAGSTSAGTVWLNQGTDPSNLVWVCWNSTICHLEAKNYQFYKQLKELFDNGKLFTLPESTLNVEKINRTTSELGLAPGMAITPANLGLNYDQILIFDKSAFVGVEISNGEQEDQTTVNNLTRTIKKIKVGKVATFLPTGAAAVVTVPQILDLSDNITP